jgi:hypothetical protein
MKNFFLLLTAFLFIVQLIPYAQQGSTLSVNNVQVAFPFSDNVEDTSTSNANWSHDANAWNMQITNAHSGTYVWAMVSASATGTWNYLTLASNIDLSSSANPYLSFWIRKADGGSGILRAEVSTDAGSTWALLPQGQQNFNGTLYNWFEFPLSNYRQTTTRIRIGCYVPYGNTYFLDDFLIDDAPTPQPIVLSQQQNNGMHVHLGQSTALDFYKYRVVLSTDQNAVNNYYVTPGVNNRGETKVFDIFDKAYVDTTLVDITFTNTQYYAKVYEQDSQDLINQGSDRVDLATTFSVTPQVAPFTQDFEGTYSWAADIPWAVTTADGGDAGHSTSHAYEDSPDGNYDANADRRLVMQVNLASVQRPLLKFNHKYSYEQGQDYGYVEISGDNVNWTTLTGFTGNSAGSWESREFDIGILKNQTSGYVRFRTTSNNGTQQDGWHIDDVQVSQNDKTTAFPFFDNADTNSVSQNLWVAGSFDLRIANDHTGGGQVWALGQSGGTWNYLTLAGRMNLSSASNPYVSFWVKKANSGSGIIRAEASNDAGLTWNLLPQGQQNFNGTLYNWFEFPLADYRQANVLIRIGCYSPYGDTYFIDDILIDNAPTPRPLTLLTPTNNGMKVKWGASTATDFGNYRVVLTTVANNVNPTNAASGAFVSSGYSFHDETRVFDIFNKATIETTLTDLAFTNTHYYSKIYEIDKQGLINQGSDMVDLFTTFNVTAEVAPFLETFEGTYSWAADLPWAVTEFDSSDPDHSPTHAFEDSPDGNYLPNSDRRLVMSVNLVGVSRPVLRFNHKYNFEQGQDFGYLDYSTDNVNWSTITGFTGNSEGLWEKREFDVGSLKQVSTGYVRFRTYSNNGTNYDGWHLDDVEIYNNSKGQPVPVIDSVEVDSVSQNYWIPGAWGIKTANAHSGSQVWALEPAGGTWNYITLNGIQNLASAPNPYISFWIKKANSGSGIVRTEVSNDAGLTWNLLPQGQQNFNGASYTKFNYSLINYRQNNVVVRIGGYSPYGDTYLLDDIEIADSTGFTGIKDLAGVIPSNFELSQNYPNPFNPSTTIRYALPSESKVTITVYNLLGQELATLVNDIKSSGYHEVVFNAANLSSGVYLYTVRAVTTEGSKDFNSTKKLILLK